LRIPVRSGIGVGLESHIIDKLLVNTELEVRILSRNKLGVKPGIK
jgi:hypothetical protein